MKRILIILATAVAIASCGRPAVESINVVPYPNDVTIKSGTFNLAANNCFHISADMDQASRDAAASFAAQLSLTSGIEFGMNEGSGSNGFVFRYNPEIEKEGYRLDVSRKAAVAEVSSLNGVIYAIQTIKQMLPVEVFGTVAAVEAVSLCQRRRLRYQRCSSLRIQRSSS